MAVWLITSWMFLAADLFPIHEKAWLLESAGDWKAAHGSSSGFEIYEDDLILKGTNRGEWISKWHAWKEPVSSLELKVNAAIDLFDNKAREVLITGAERPFTNADGQPHDWYGRCMISILGPNRWIMAVRSGVNHIDWDGRDAIHIMTSSDEGRTWNGLDRWFDGTSVDGMPFEDGFTHSEPGLYRMPNGELVLQFWRSSYHTGTRQLRSTDNGKTWTSDTDRVRVEGVIGAEDDRVIGTEDWFIDPEYPNDVYMAFQYFHYQSQSGTLLARTRDDGRSYQFLSWIGPLRNDRDENSGANFEPAIEYVGNRTIIAILRHASGNRYTWQAVSTDMGQSFSDPVDISDQVDAGVTNGLWQRVRLYKDTNPIFQYGNQWKDYADGRGRLWGFGLHSNGGGYTRKPVVYWSDDNGVTWEGPELLHGNLYPGTDSGYGDLKRRVDNTYVGAAYYATRDSKVADVEQYTFGGTRLRVRVDLDQDHDAQADEHSPWFDVYDGSCHFPVRFSGHGRLRFELQYRVNNQVSTPKITSLQIRPVILGEE
jgi:hypothetical protein